MRQRWPPSQAGESRFRPNRGPAGGEPWERRGEVWSARARAPAAQAAPGSPLGHNRLELPILTAYYRSMVGFLLQL